MKKGYYIHFEGRISPGVSQKIDMQMDEFRKYYLMEEVEVETPPRTLPKRILGLFPTASIKREYGKALGRIKNPDFLYIRRAVADRAYVSFFKEIRRRCPNCKIIIELYTYPYDRDDFGRWDAWPFYLKELLYRNRQKKYVDRFVTYSLDEVIFGVKTIPAMNGINVASVRPVTPKAEHGDEIHMIAVAYMQEHHGYERMLYGMDEYYRGGGRRNLVLHLVGDGPEKGTYRRITEQLHLSEHVRFYPSTRGEALDAIYDMADMAVSSLGVYKKGVHRLSALKTRECLAKGLPMITGCDVDVLIGTDYPYYCQFPNDATPIDIERIVRFYDEVIAPKDRAELIEEIRRFAFQTVDMSIAMQPIVDYIDGRKEKNGR